MKNAVKLIVWNCNGYHATDPENYNSFIMDSWKILDISNFETREQILDYFKKYFGFNPEQIDFVD